VLCDQYGCLTEQPLDTEGSPQRLRAAKNLAAESVRPRCSKSINKS
jgi:hypothetical protein